MPELTFTAQAAALAALLTLAAVVLGPVAAHLGWLEPLAGFGLFMGGLVLGGLSSLGLGLVALVRARGLGAPVWVWLVVGVGVMAVVGLALFISTVARVPRIHDITTSPTDPPEFRQIAQQPANQGRDLRYPQGGSETPELQRRAYPDLVPIALAVPPERAFEMARQAVEDLGWTLVWSSAELGVIEAYEETRVFRFVDDVAIRVRGAGEGSIIDVRSTSRVGQSDLGVNAARIRRFAARVHELSHRGRSGHSASGLTGSG